MKASILIVEDDELVREGIARYLSDDYVIHTASNGHEAVGKINEKGNIDVVLSDLKMPEMDGIELLEKIRADSRDTMVIFMTGFSSIESAAETIQKGAYDYLTKPLDLVKLDITVKNAVENKRLRSEILLLKQKLREKSS